MKKSVIALAVGALVAATSAAQAATIYDKDGTQLAIGGRLQGRYVGTNVEPDGMQPASGDASLNASGRLSIEGRTHIAEGLDAFGYVEWDVADYEENFNFAARYAWVGLDFGSAGQFKGGTFEDAFYYVEEVMDIFEDMGGLSIPGMDDKMQGNLMYSWSDFGVDVNVSYQTSKGRFYEGGNYWGALNTDAGQASMIEGAFAISAGYSTPDVAFGPISVRLGYGFTEYSSHKNSSGSYVNETSYGGLLDQSYKYGISVAWGEFGEGPYVALTYNYRSFKVRSNAITSSTVGNNLEVTGYGILGGYTDDSGWGVHLALEFQDAETESGWDVSAATLPILISYAFNDNFDVWFECRFDIGTDDDPGAGWADYIGDSYDHTSFILGLRFSF